MDQGKQTNEAHISVWDHPESRIAYLEAVMNGTDWRACVYAPPHSPHAEKTLLELGSALKKRGYDTAMNIDEHGNHNLHIHRFSDRPSLMEAVHEMGFAKGIGYSLTHPGETASNLYQGAKDGINYTTANTARLLGGFYMAGDAAMWSAPFFEQKTKSNIEETLHKTNKIPNRLAGMYGALALLQSAIYIGYAQDGHEKQTDALNGAFSDGMKTGYKHLDISKWHNHSDKESLQEKTLLNNVNQMLHDHPIGIGAAAQVLAGAITVGSGALRFKNINAMKKSGKYNGETQKEALKTINEHFTSSKTDMGFGALTAASWTILPQPSREEGEEKTSILHNIADKPAKISAPMSAIASLSGITSGFKRGNAATIGGQGIYLMGDATMFLLKSSEYGASGKNAESLMIEAASHFMHESPMIFGEPEQQEFTQHLARYMVQQLDDVVHEDMPKLIETVATGINDELSTMPDKADAFIASVAMLAEHFPENKRTGVIQQLSESIAEMPGVFMDKEVLSQKVTEKLEHLPHQHTASKLPSMHTLAPHITTLLAHLPPMQAANNANALYETLMPHMKTTAHDQTIFTKNMMDYTAEVSGIPPHIIKSQLATEASSQRGI